MQVRVGGEQKKIEQNNQKFWTTKKWQKGGKSVFYLSASRRVPAPNF